MLFVGLPLLLVGGGGAVAFTLLAPGRTRPELLTAAVKPEFLPVTVVERGTLESADNREVVCKVKAGARGTFASTIKWVIDDGTRVVKGQPIMELDDSALLDQEQTQVIAVSKADAAWVKAKEELDIQNKANAADMAAKLAALRVAELDLEKFLGVRPDPLLDPLGAIASAPFTLIERGEYRMKLDDVSGRMKLAESDLQAYRDRSAWAERSSRLGYLTGSQAKVEQTKYASGMDALQKVQKEKFALETFSRSRDLVDLASKVDVAEAGYEQAVLQAHAKTVQAEAEVKTTALVSQQEQAKLREISTQLVACKLVSPQTGMAVYYKDPNQRFSSNGDGMIAVGSQVKEGQKLLRIPDLSRMRVNTKIHEALVARIKGDDRRPTGVYDATRAALLVNPNAFARMLSQSDYLLDGVRDATRDYEVTIARQGMPATVKVDAFPGRVFAGRVRTVAEAAAQADWNSSDVKLYQTLVSIDDTDVAGLKPDMSAEVTIQVDPAEQKVLTVPVQAVVGGAEMGTKRKVYVLANGAPQEREVTLGLFNDKKVEVREGLVEDEVVVLNPKAILGDKARTREEGDPTGRGAGRGPGGGPGGKKGGGSGGPPSAAASGAPAGGPGGRKG